MMIRWLENSAEKQTVCRKILEALPEWYGIPEANDAYVKDVLSCAMVVEETAEETVGFIAVKPTANAVLSLHVLGVMPDQHGKGSGTKMMNAVRRYAKDKGHAYLSVKTLDPARQHDGYASTRRFYEREGFFKVETFPTLWDKDNPCLFMLCRL